MLAWFAQLGFRSLCLAALDEFKVLAYLDQSASLALDESVLKDTRFDVQLRSRKVTVLVSMALVVVYCVFEVSPICFL